MNVQNGASLRNFRIHLAAACVVLAASLWASTGTMAVYGASLSSPLVEEECQYLRNIDHQQFLMTFLMIDGAPKETFEQSVMLRRLLYPIAAYVPMKLFGFEYGGFVTNVIISVVSLIVFGFYLRRRVGAVEAILGCWFLALYPGFAYWGGLPYSHAAIVPCTLLGFVVLERLDSPKLRPVYAAASALALGVLCTAYDLLPYFGPAAILLLLWNRQWVLAPMVGLLMVVPPQLVNLLLVHHYGVPLENSNTASYSNIISSYFSVPDFLAWFALLAELPYVIYTNFLFSNFLFLPLLFLAALALEWRCRLKLSRAELSFLAAVAAVFLFLNLAPPYEGRWQLRGDWLARLYQPMLAPLLVFSLRKTSSVVANTSAKAKRLAIGVWATVIVLNASVIFGPYVRLPHAATLYHHFYRHGPTWSFYSHLDQYGARPYGFCRAKADAAEPPSTR